MAPPPVSDHVSKRASLLISEEFDVSHRDIVGRSQDQYVKDTQSAAVIILRDEFHLRFREITGVFRCDPSIVFSCFPSRRYYSNRPEWRDLYLDCVTRVRKNKERIGRYVTAS